MKNKTCIAGLISLGVRCVSGAYIMYKYYCQRRNDRAKALKDTGNDLFNKKEYSKAKDQYLAALKVVGESDEEYKNILNNLSIVYFLIADYSESLKFTDKLLALEKYSKRTLKRKYEILYKLGRKRDSLLILFVLNIVAKEKKDKYKELANSLLREIVTEETQKKIKTNGAFPGEKIIKYQLMTFPSLFQKIEDSNLSYKEIYDYFEAISKNEYPGESNIEAMSKIEDLSESKAEELSEAMNKIELNNTKEKYKVEGKLRKEELRLFKAIIENIRSKHNEALELLRMNKEIESKIFFYYINLEKNGMQENFGEIFQENQGNPTVLYYLTHIFKALGDERYKECIELGLALDRPLFAYLTVCIEIEGRRLSESFSILNKILEMQSVGDKEVEILLLLYEYFYFVKDEKGMARILPFMTERCAGDCRVEYFKGLKAEVEQKNPLEFYKRSLELDPGFYKAYIFIGNFLMMANDLESRGWFEQGLGKAVSADEIYSVLQSLLLLELQERTDKEYPELNKLKF